jgi:hypothetical protein
MSGSVEVVLIVAVVIYMLVTRLIGQPAQAKRMLILPAVLAVIGLTDLSGGLKSPMSMLFLVGTVAISALIGAARGASVRISRRNGLAFVRYTGWTVALWVLNLVVKFGANFVLSSIDAKDAAGVSSSLLFTLGTGMLVEGLVVLYRALRADHPVSWSASRDGGQVQPSPFLDNVRRNIGNRREETNRGTWR